MTIDVHAHFFPSSILAEIPTREATLGVSLEDGGVLAFPTGRGRPLFSALMDIGGRRTWNEQRGIDRQVLSPWMDVAGDGLEGDRARAWARLYNDGVAAELDGDPRFLAFATLPVTDGDAAGAELVRCVEGLGFVGGALPTQVSGRNLADAGLEPLFAAAEELDVALFLHPFRVLGADRLRHDFMTNLCGNPFETTVAALSLFFSGILERFSRLRVLLSHGGGTLPLIAGRAAHGSLNNATVRRRAETPDAILGRFFYDTILHDAEALAFAIGRVGAHRCALGSDVPFPMALDKPTTHVREALDRAGLPEAFEQVAELTAASLLGKHVAPVRELD